MSTINTSAAEPSQAFDTASLLPTLDVAAGLKRLNNNKKIYKSVLSKFNTEKMTADISEKIAEGDITGITSAAHTLKGVSSNLGFDGLTALCLKIETAAKAGETEFGHFTEELARAAAAAVDAIPRLTESGVLNT
jgi:HPt (histidine-containing phosphotransfer) domain-containing protein